MSQPHLIRGSRRSAAIRPVEFRIPFAASYAEAPRLPTRRRERSAENTAIRADSATAAIVAAVVAVIVGLRPSAASGAFSPAKGRAASSVSGAAPGSVNDRLAQFGARRPADRAAAPAPAPRPSEPARSSTSGSGSIRSSSGISTSSPSGSPPVGLVEPLHRLVDPRRHRRQRHHAGLHHGRAQRRPRSAQSRRPSGAQFALEAQLAQRTRSPASRPAPRRAAGVGRQSRTGSPAGAGQVGQPQSGARSGARCHQRSILEQGLTFCNRVRRDRGNRCAMVRMRCSIGRRLKLGLAAIFVLWLARLHDAVSQSRLCPVGCRSGRDHGRHRYPRDRRRSRSARRAPSGLLDDSRLVLCPVALRDTTPTGRRRRSTARSSRSRFTTRPAWSATSSASGWRTARSCALSRRVTEAQQSAASRSCSSCSAISAGSMPRGSSAPDLRNAAARLSRGPGVRPRARTSAPRR